MKKCLIISNPYSGHSSSEKFKDEIMSIVSKHNYIPIFISTEYPKHAMEIAKTVEGVDLLLSIGGDGTLHEVTCGNISRSNSLTQAHIPTGTTNDVGKMYGLNNDVLSSAEKVMNGREKDVDFFKINEEPFVYVAGMGQFLHIPYITTKESKDKYGHAAYLKGGLDAWKEGTKLYNFDYEIDGKKYNTDGSIIVVTNTTRIAGFNGAYKSDFAKLNDGLFEVGIVQISNKLKLLRGAAQFILKDATKVNGAKVIQTDNIKIHFNDKLLHNPCVDGEEYKSTTDDYEFKKAKKVKMLLPKDNLNKLFK